MRPRTNQNKAMTRLLKRREGERQTGPEGTEITDRYWRSLCREREPIRSPIVQRSKSGKQGAGD